jgi:hypothetical protein
MRLKKLAFLAPFILIVSASVSYAVGFQIVKDPWNILETHSGFAQTVSWLSQVHDKVFAHYKYAMYRDTWTSPLSVRDELSRLASLNVKVRQEVGWGQGGVLEQKLPNIANDLNHIQDVIERGDSGGPGSLRQNVSEIYGDATSGSVDRSYRDMTATYLQAGRANQAIQENLKNAQVTKSKLENCGQCTQSDKDRLTTELNYYLTMASQYQAQSSNYQALLQADTAGIAAGRVNQENQNRWHERDQASALVRMTRVGIGTIGSPSRQD